MFSYVNVLSFLCFVILKNVVAKSNVITVQKTASGGFREGGGGQDGSAPFPLGRRTDAVTHGTPDM